MKSKWLIALLVLSLALNLALVGFMIGRSSATLAADPTRGFPRWAQQLPSDRREALRPMLRHGKDMRSQLRTLRQHHRALQRALTAEPFDAESLASVLADMRAAYARVESANHASFQKFVAELTPAERAELAGDLARPRRHRPPPH